VKNFGYLCAVSVAVIAQSAAAQTTQAQLLTTITGEVTSVTSATPYTLTMKSGVSYIFTPATRIVIKGAPSLVSNLKVGMTCTLQYAYIPQGNNISQGNYITKLGC
jgi:hypothetical protein